MTVVFFGYTQCPDVCPTTMAELAQIRKLLGADGDKLQTVFVTIDPERDTAEILKAYVANFGPGRRRAARRRRADGGGRQGVQGLLRQGARQVDAGSYTMDHSAASFVFDPAGRVRLFVPYGSDPKVLATDLKQLVAAG